MVYTSITRKAPEYISSMLIHVSDHHEWQTRSTAPNLLHIQHTLTFYRAFSKLWNSLPADIRNSKFINMFKSELICSTVTRTFENPVVFVTAPYTTPTLYPPELAVGAKAVFGWKLDLSATVGFVGCVWTKTRPNLTFLEASYVSKR